MIKIEGLTSKYSSEGNVTFALDSVNIEINSGEVVAILGRNGSGKSTLAKHLNAIMLPDSGRVLVDALDTRDHVNTYMIRRNVGMVFQNPENQMVSSVIEDDVAFAPENLGLSREEIRKRVDEALIAVGMYEERFKAPRLLSGGQKQRVAIAGIIAMQPDYIVLDEATAMLDPAGRKEVMDTVLRLNKEKNITVIMITHFMDEAARADRIIVMDNGKKLRDGTPREIFSDEEEIERLGLSLPPASELSHRLIKAGINLPKDSLCEEDLIYDIKELYEKRRRGDD